MSASPERRPRNGEPERGGKVRAFLQTGNAVIVFDTALLAAVTFAAFARSGPREPGRTHTGRTMKDLKDMRDGVKDVKDSRFARLLGHGNRPDAPDGGGGGVDAGDYFMRDSKK